MRFTIAWVAALGLLLGWSLGCGPRGRRDTLRPPRGFTAVGGIEDVMLTWNPAPGATSYNLYWDTSTGVSPATGIQVPGVASPYLHSGLTNGTTYYYVITALSPGGAAESEPSAQVSATPNDTLGLLDSTFGGRGWVTHDNAAGGNAVDQGEDLCVDSSGRILVTGSSYGGSTGGDMVIWRYRPDGTLDPAFNGRGWVTHHDAAGQGGSSRDVGEAIAIDAQDRIVVAGESGSTDDDMVIWRYNPSGTLDSTFNGRGWVVHDNAAGGGGDDIGFDIALDPSGKILVTGDSDGGTNFSDMALWSYDPSGALDTTFNGQGWVVHHNAAGGDGRDSGYALALDSSGRIVVAGSSVGPGTSDDMVIWRYNRSGTLDSTFNGQGWVVHDNAAGGNGADFGNDIGLDSYGRLIVAGASEGANLDMVIWRYEPSGALDSTFNGQGWVVHDNAAGGNGSDGALGLELDSWDRIYVTGASAGTTGFRDLAVWRYDPAGALDTTFNGQGWVVHDNAAGGNGDDVGRAITLDASGRILVTGWSVKTPTNYDMAIWRFR